MVFSNNVVPLVESVTVDGKVMDDFKKSKLIFYSLPSPLETAMLIKELELPIMRNCLIH